MQCMKQCGTPHKPEGGSVRAVERSELTVPAQVAQVYWADTHIWSLLVVRRQTYKLLLCLLSLQHLRGEWWSQKNSPPPSNSVWRAERAAMTCCSHHQVLLLRRPVRSHVNHRTTAASRLSVQKHEHRSTTNPVISPVCSDHLVRTSRELCCELICL